MLYVKFEFKSCRDMNIKLYRQTIMKSGIGKVSCMQEYSIKSLFIKLTYCYPGVVEY
jgi:hypothetical protein